MMMMMIFIFLKKRGDAMHANMVRCAATPVGFIAVPAAAHFKQGFRRKRHSNNK